MLPPNLTRSPYHFPIRRPVTVTMIVLTAAVFGLLSYSLLPINMMPDITYPSLTVRTEFQGAAPEEVEDAVTRPIEQSLGVIRNLVEMSSSSRTEVSDILLEFDWDSDMNRATQDVREKLDVVFLSEDVKPPLILRYDPSLDPMIRIGLTSDSLNLLQLRTLADDNIKRELEKITGIAAVKVKGGEEAEIRVAVNAAKLDLMNLSIETVLQRLASENINIAGGRLQEGETEFIIRTLNEFMIVEEISEIVIDLRHNKPVFLSDIATVSRRPGEKTTIARVGSLEAVEIEIYKESEANPIAVSEVVKKRIFGIDKEKKSAENKKRKKTKGRKGDHGIKRGPKPLAEVLTNRVRIHILANQADFIKQSINNVRSAALIGGLLAVMVLLLFLGKVQDTLVVALVIPISLICAFAAMHLAKVSLNIMSLGGLALGVGMMVDNAIVVIESIHRRREVGDDLISSAVTGARTVGGAVTASTLTTVVVFFPIVFVSGIAGQVFGDMALTVIISLSVSLIMALFFIPMLLTRGNSNGKFSEQDPWQSPRTTPVSAWIDFKSDLSRWRRFRRFNKIITALVFVPYLIIKLILSFLLNSIFWLYYFLLIEIRWLLRELTKPAFTRILKPLKDIGNSFRRSITSLTELYARMLKQLLKRSGFVLILSLFICVISFFFLLPSLGGELIPEVSQGTFNLELTLPVGTPLERTAGIIYPFERKLSEMPGIKKVSSRIGGEIMSAEQSIRGPNSAVVTVMMNPGGNLEQLESEIVRVMRREVQNIPSLELLVTHPTLFSFKQPIEVILKGSDLNQVRSQGLEIEARLSNLPMLADVESTVRPGHPEVIIKFDRFRLARLGINARKAADRVQAAVLGKVPTRFREEERRIDIRVQMEEADRESVEELKNLVINPGQSIPVNLSDVATLEVVEGPSEITHAGGVRAVMIKADVVGSDLKSADAAIRSELSEMNLIEGYDYVISGQRREMEESLASLRFAFLLAIFLVYVVMASQFESLKHPFLILLTIPLAVAGVVTALWALNISLSIMVFLGLIVLAGIVVNNSIVLVDYINQIVRSGVPIKDAVIEAAKTRMRPILMTSLTTILALLPMALGMGEGVEIRRPMAITVIIGLSIATLVTLIVIPLLYCLITRKQQTG